MFDIVALGEVLIDFIPSGISETGQKLFEQNPGGAPANVLAALSKLGKRTAFIGKVGDDMHGEYLVETMKKLNIDTSGMIMDPNVFTTLAFVSLNENGERSFSFARKPGADTCLSIEELRLELLQNTKIFHFGSLSLTDEPSRSATWEAVKQAKSAGAVISYDPNYRRPLWEKEETAKEQIGSVLGLVDILKISDEETELLTNGKNPEIAAKILHEQGIPLVVVTLGSKGALVCTKEGSGIAAGYKSKVIDTTGAGDSFWGGFLYQIIVSGKNPAEVTLEECMEFAKFANAAASLCVERRGAIPAMSTLDEIVAVLSSAVHCNIRDYIKANKDL